MEEIWIEWYERTPKYDIKNQLRKLKNQKRDDENWIEQISNLDGISEEQIKKIKARIDIVSKKITLYEDALNVL